MRIRIPSKQKKKEKSGNKFKERENNRAGWF